MWGLNLGIILENDSREPFGVADVLISSLRCNWLFFTSPYEINCQNNVNQCNCNKCNVCKPEDVIPQRKASTTVKWYKQGIRVIQNIDNLLLFRRNFCDTDESTILRLKP